MAFSKSGVDNKAFTSSDENEQKETKNENKENVGLKRTVGLASGISIIIGTMIGMHLTKILVFIHVFM